MAKPNLVADCIKAMKDAVNIEITIKHRIGINNIESYEFVRDFAPARPEKRDLLHD